MPIEILKIHQKRKTAFQSINQRRLNYTNSKKKEEIKSFEIK